MTPAAISTRTPRPSDLNIICVAAIRHCSMAMLSRFSHVRWITTFGARTYAETHHASLYVTIPRRRPDFSRDTTTAGKMDPAGLPIAAAATWIIQKRDTRTRVYYFNYALMLIESFKFHWDSNALGVIYEYQRFVARRWKPIRDSFPTKNALISLTPWTRYIHSCINPISVAQIPSPIVSISNYKLE